MDNPPIVVFSSVSENTLRFANKLNLPFYRIPVHLKEIPTMENPFILLTPTYGGGQVRGSVPKQVVRFFNAAEQNRTLCQGTIVSGNTTFGIGYATAGKIIANKMPNVPLLHIFEVLGTSADVHACRELVFEMFPDTEQYRNATEKEFAQYSKFSL